MLKIKRTSQLIARDVPYIMHPKQAIKTLRQRYGVSDHRDFASSHLHEQYRTQSIDFPLVSANDLEDGRVVVLESMAQHYAVDSKGTVRNFLPSVLEFKVRHLLGQPRKENVRQEQDYFAEVKALLEDQYPMPLEAPKVVEKPKTLLPTQVSKTVSDRPWDQAIWEDTPWAEKSLVSVGWLFHKASEGLSSVSQWSDDTVKTIDQIGEDPETSELMRATAAALKTPARLGTGIVSGVAGTANLVISPEKRQQLKDGVIHLYNNPEIIKQLAKDFAEKPTYQQVADVFVIAGEAAIPVNALHKLSKAGKIASKVNLGVDILSDAERIGLAEVQKLIASGQKLSKGDVREFIVAAATKGRLPKDANFQDEIIRLDPSDVNSPTTGIDVISAEGNIISVGGPSKGAKPERLADTLNKLEILKAEANRRGVKAQAFFEAGDSEKFKTLIEACQKSLGKENVYVFPAEYTNKLLSNLKSQL
jgi:hypothetical protein